VSDTVRTPKDRFARYAPRSTYCKQGKLAPRIDRGKLWPTQGTRPVRHD